MLKVKMNVVDAMSVFDKRCPLCCSRFEYVFTIDPTTGWDSERAGDQ